MDFITNFSFANGKDSITIVVDHSTKMAHFISCNKSVTWKEIAKLFLGNIYRIHELSNDIVLDRGIQFTSNFWRTFSVIWCEKSIFLQCIIYKLMENQRE
jgi:hypothetical protein